MTDTSALDGWGDYAQRLAHANTEMPASFEPVDLSRSVALIKEAVADLTRLGLDGHRR